MIYMFYQAGFPKPPWRSQRDVPTIMECFQEVLRLLLAITEILRRLISGDEERVVNLCLHIIAIILLRKYRNANIAINFYISK